MSSQKLNPFSNAVMVLIGNGGAVGIDEYLDVKYVLVAGVGV